MKVTVTNSFMPSTAHEVEHASNLNESLHNKSRIDSELKPSFLEQEGDQDGSRMSIG